MKNLWLKRCRAFVGYCLLLIMNFSASADEVQLQKTYSTFTYTENFNGPIESVMLSGAITFGKDGPWNTEIKDQHLTLTNISDGEAVQYFKIPAVISEKLSSLITTSGSIIEAEVRVNSEERAGVGLVVPVSGNSIFLAINNHGVLFVGNIMNERSSSRDATSKAKFILQAATMSTAIKKDSLNKIAVKWDNGDLIFLINDQVAFFYPDLNRSSSQSWRNNTQITSIGIAAFGIGSFEFDKIEIIGPEPDAVMPPLLSPPQPITYERSGPRIMTPCSEIPMAKATDQIAIYATRQGAAISNIALSGVQNVTNAADVIIEDGKEPIFLVLITETATIWRITGATERLSKVLLISNVYGLNGTPAVGVTGVKREIVAFSGPSDCMLSYYFDDQNLRSKTLALAAAEKNVGRTLETFVSDEWAFSIAIPSAKRGKIANLDPNISELSTGIPKKNGQRLPAGSVEIKQEDVLTMGVPEYYETLPGEIGFSKLLANGTIEKTNGIYKIVKPLKYFPTRLSWREREQIVLGKGLPIPIGIVGSNDLVLEETGQRPHWPYSVGGSGPYIGPGGGIRDF